MKLPKETPIRGAKDVEKMRRFRGRPLAFLAYVGRDHWWFFVIIGLLQFCQSSAAVISPFVYADLTRWLQDGSLTLTVALSGGAVIFLAYLLDEVFFALTSYFNSLRCARTAPRAKLLLLEYTLGQSYDFFTRNLSGKTAGRINQIGDSMNEIAWSLMMICAGVGSRLFLVASILLCIHWQLAVLFVLWAVVFYHHNIKKMASIRQKSMELSDCTSTTSGQVVDSISNFQVLFSCGGALRERNRIESFLKEEVTAQKSIAFREFGMLLSRANWFGFLGIILIIGSFSLVASHQITIPQLSMVVGLWFACTGVQLINWLIGGLLWHHAKAQEQLTGVLEPYTVLESTKTIHIARKTPVIAVNHLTFAYPNGNRIFQNLSMTIPPRQKIGLVGRSGAGKSTLISIIMRYYDPQSGSVTFDGTDIRAATRENLREIIAIVPQDPSLFHRSILENVRFGNPGATIEEVKEACRKAHAHDFIAQLPLGYETPAGEHGFKLSVGQRQRIAIARAILKDAPIVIFDEATSALDSESELAIQQAIGSLFARKTFIVIAHRLSTLREMDRVVVFDAGKIVEDGAPSELLAKGGLYAKFWNMQSQGFIGDSDSTEPTLEVI